MTVVIEDVGEQAAGLLAALHRRCVDPAETRPWSTLEYSTLLRLPTTRAAVAIWEGAGERDPVGFIVCASAADQMDLLFVGVVPDRRRSGAGGRLLLTVVRQARLAAVRRILLEVAADNVAAQRLYSGQGFSEVGRRRAYYPRARGEPVDAIVMELQV